MPNFDDIFRDDDEVNVSTVSNIALLLFKCFGYGLHSSRKHLGQALCGTSTVSPYSFDSGPVPSIILTRVFIGCLENFPISRLFDSRVPR